RTADLFPGDAERYSRGRPHPINREGGPPKRRNPPMLRIDRGACRWIGVALATAVVMTGCSHQAGKTAAPAKTSPARSPAPPPPPTCPLTGVQGGSVPNRPALAIKVENAPESRPPVGLDAADVIYEEPVEGGITRFVVVYQCHDAARVEPVRSVRQADPYLVN